jgi:hypothetical protein
MTGGGWCKFYAARRCTKSSFVDPNLKESEGFGRIRIRKKVRIRIRIRIQILLLNKNNLEKSGNNHLKENKMYVTGYVFSIA